LNAGQQQTERVTFEDVHALFAEVDAVRRRITAIWDEVLNLWISFPEAESAPDPTMHEGDE
jgi:hypothetical protein